MSESNIQELEDICNAGVSFAAKNKNNFGNVLEELGGAEKYLHEDSRYLVLHSTYDQQKENELEIKDKDSLTKEPFVNWSDAEKLRAIIKCGEQGGLDNFGIEDYLEFIKNAFKEPTDYLKSIACHLISSKNFKEMIVDDLNKFGFDSWSKESQKQFIYRVLKFGGPKNADFKELVSLIGKFFAEDFRGDSGKSVLEELADTEGSIFNNINYDSEADFSKLPIVDQYAIFNKFGDQDSFKPQNEAIKILHKYKKSGKSLEELKFDDIKEMKEIGYTDELFLLPFCKNKESATLDNFSSLEFNWSQPIKLFADNLSKYNNINLDPKLIAILRLSAQPKFYAFQNLPPEMQTEDNFRFIIYPEIISSTLSQIGYDNYTYNDISAEDTEKELLHIKLLAVKYLEAVENVLVDKLTKEDKKLLSDSKKALSKADNVGIFAKLWQLIIDLYKYITWNAVGPRVVSECYLHFNPLKKTKVRVIEEKLSSAIKKLNEEFVSPKLEEITDSNYKKK